jgi:hypothetical protein
MEIEEKNFNQYKDISNKEYSQNNKQQNSNQDNLLKKDKKDAYNEFLSKISKSLKAPQDKKNISQNITFRTSYDKTKQYNEQGTHILNNNEINPMKNTSNSNYSINIQTQQQYSTGNSNKRQNNFYINNVYNKEIEYENNNSNNDINRNNSNYENKVMNNNMNFGGSRDTQNAQNNNNLIEYENNNIYYQPFNNKNKMNDRKNDSKNNLVNKNNNENDDDSIHIPNIILTVIHEDKNNNIDQSGKNSGFFNFCKKKKDNKNIQENNNNNIELETIDQKLISNPFKNNNNNLNDNNNDNRDKNNIILTGSPNDENNPNYNFTLGKNQNIPQNNNNDDKSNEELIEYEPENQNKNDNNGPFIESQNIYQNQNDNNNKNKPNCIYLQAIPIENSNQINNNQNEEGAMGISSQNVDIDKDSEYTIVSNIDRLIKQKCKLSPFLIAILLGSLGLLFLLYKSSLIKSLLMNLLKMFKIIPEFFKGLLGGLFGKEISDFLEKYSDGFRFLGFIVMLFAFWIVFRIFMKYVYKLMKRNN